MISLPLLADQPTKPASQPATQPHTRTLYTAHTQVGDNFYTYAETDHLLIRRHWMTQDDMVEYDATPVTYPARKMLLDFMLDRWGLREENLIIREIKYEQS